MEYIKDLINFKYEGKVELYFQRERRREISDNNEESLKALKEIGSGKYSC